METDEVYPALQAGKQAHKRVCMAFVVIKASKHRIFETHAALPREVILLDQVDHFCAGISDSLSSGKGLWTLTARWHLHPSR